MVVRRRDQPLVLTIEDLNAPDGARGNSHGN